ncbi:MAG: aminopeptidase [Erysipelotrichaceae bacterium]|nr:aminopeptidase [Erysipelotrichaceae bacterium]
MYAKNAWNKYDSYDDIMTFANEYKNFITKAKTERTFVNETLTLIKQKGYKDIREYDTLKPGDKVYINNRNKNMILFVIGKNDMTQGLRILGAHIDSPRLDIKQNPLYEKDGFVLLDTHYYGGIKKYQWLTIPLSLMGVVVKKDGSVIDINIGEKDDDPVVGISDLLPHLASDQLKKTANEFIGGENLDITIGSIPLKDEEKDSVKANILKLFKDQYDIEEEDFLSAEIEVVPSGKARDYGLDQSMILAYGHDDKCCAFTSLQAILDMDDVDYTSCCLLVDKEEIGSMGATGAQSVFFENSVAEILHLAGHSSYLDLKRTLTNSKVLSSDVSNGFDPLYAEVSERKNAAFLGNGIVFNKYVGARGKSGSNDANAEYVAEIRKIMDESNIHFQTAEVGKVDQGGGGTISCYMANYNMNVIDAGIPILSMHAPYEILSKVDLYEAYLAYKTFLQKA